VSSLKRGIRYTGFIGGRDREQPIHETKVNTWIMLAW